MLDPDIQALVEMGDLIAAIGLYQQRHGGSALLARKAIDRARQQLATAADPDAPVVPTAPITQVNDPEVDDLLRRGNKIAAIKRYRELYNVGLKDAKDAVEAMEAGQPVSHPTAPSTTDAPQLQPELDRLIAADQKIAAIKHYRDVTHVGLKEAKDAVEAHMAATAPARAPGRA